MMLVLLVYLMGVVHVFSGIAALSKKQNKIDGKDGNE